MRLLLAAIMLTCALPARPQDSALGRLFFTPQQRASLDRQRQPSQNERHEQTASNTLHGEVRRSSGKNTRWINGEAQYVNGATSSGEQQKLPGGRIVVSPGRSNR